MAIALHHSKAKGAEKLILIGIANHDGDGGAWPSMATLAKYGSVSRDQARKHVVALEQRGEIRRVVNGGGTFDVPSYTRPNRYLFMLQCPADCDRSKNHRTRNDLAQPVFMDIDQTEPAESFAALLELVPDPPSPVLAPTNGDSEHEGGHPSPMRDKPSYNPTTDLPETNSSNRAREAVSFDACPKGHGRPHSYSPKTGLCIDCGALEEIDQRTGELRA